MKIVISIKEVYKHFREAKETYRTSRGEGRTLIEVMRETVIAGLDSKIAKMTRLNFLRGTKTRKIMRFHQI
jgi:hypothetical protein